MLKKPLLLLMLGLLLAIAFVAGVTQLFELRQRKGDVYPPYSSLRADPLGVKGIYEALAQLPGVNLERNYKPLPKLKTDGPITLVYAGVHHTAAWEDQELRDFDGLILAGSRAIFTFIPLERTPLEEQIRREEKEEERKKKLEKEKEKEKKEAEEKPKGEKLGAKNRKSADAKEAKKNSKNGKDAKDKKSDKDEEPEPERIISFRVAANRWGFNFGYQPANEDKAFHRMAIATPAAVGLEHAISWHTALYFKDLKPNWKVLYTCEDHPVIIERSFGNGTLVFSADSFFLSNEALRLERSPHLVARLFDGPPKVIFDEDHHGVKEEPGMATLARKYRLGGVVAGLVVLTLLFLWKNSVRFIPAQRSSADQGDVVAGKESSEGFVNLLRRTIKPSEILGICVGEWRKAFPNRPREMARIDEIFAREQARPARERNTVSAYQTICRSLTRQP